MSLENRIPMIQASELKQAFTKPGGILVPIILKNKETAVRVIMEKKLPGFHRLEIDVDATGMKISDQGRKNLKKLTERIGQPDVREPERSFVNTYILDIEVQREDSRLRGELLVLDQLFGLLFSEENLEPQPR